VQAEVPPLGIQTQILLLAVQAAAVILLGVTVLLVAQGQ
tara:strand:- start:383 stop:499 length:117 start_codon:yes stop_codon:yes gene_type:complete